MNNHLSHPKYRPDIDGLRAIAVLSVVFYHAFPNWIGGGYIGVDIFFVISGYLISTIIFENLDRKTFSFSEFYMRRVKRIFPALSLVLIVCYGFGWFALLADEFKQLGKHVAAGAGFVSNFVLWSEAGYFDISAEKKPLLHLWSLGIEEQFYIVWPFLLWLAWKIRFNLWVTITSVAFVSFFLNIYFVHHDIVSTFYSPQTRFWELICGSMLAWLTLYRNGVLKNAELRIGERLTAAINFVTQKKHTVSSTNVFSMVGLLLLVLGTLGMNKDLSFPGMWAVIPVLGAMLIIAAGSGAWCNQTILSNPLFVWFGKISFPLYLWHWPLLSYVRIIEASFPNAYIRLGAVGLAIMLAWLTYRLVETPIRLSSRNEIAAPILASLMVVVGLAGYATYLGEGLPDRAILRGLEKPVGRLGEDDTSLHAKCLANYGLVSENIRFCRLSGGLDPHIAIIGDSLGASMFQALSDNLAAQRTGLLMIGGRLFVNVGTYPDVDPGEINVYKGGIEATNFVANNKSIKTVLMFTRGSFFMNGNWNFFLIDNPEIKDRKKVFEIGLRETLNVLVKNQKRIIFVLEFPEMNFDPLTCSNERPFRLFSTAKSVNCSILKKDFDLRQKVYRDVVSAVLADYPQVTVFDPSSSLCDKQYCYAKIGEEVLYGDPSHLSYAGAKRISSQLVDVLNGTASGRE
ncbi:peptidoglycan/LPS O-acetylase OafA/YrhL [Oxalobacteraceae bacterium GrIS 2.11]